MWRVCNDRAIYVRRPEKSSFSTTNFNIAIYQRVSRLYVRMVSTRHAPFLNRMAQNSLTWHLQALLSTYTYSMTAFVPSKTLKVRKIHSSYNDIQKLAKRTFGVFIIILFFFIWTGPLPKWHKNSQWFLHKTAPFRCVCDPWPRESS